MAKMHDTTHLQGGERVLEVPDVEHGELQLDVPVVSGAVHQQLAEKNSRGGGKEQEQLC